MSALFCIFFFLKNFIFLFFFFSYIVRSRKNSDTLTVKEIKHLQKAYFDGLMNQQLTADRGRKWTKSSAMV